MGKSRGLRRHIALGALAGLIGATALTGLTLAPTASSPPAAAADLSLFRAGNIISDSIFFNGSTMSEAQIQSFLLGKVPACAAGASCLINTTQTTWTRPADAMCSAYIGAPDEPVSRIIFKVGQACGINPQVLLVMLQKEQGLITSRSPSSYSWRAAMGFACPDTAVCDAQYSWFYNQMYKAAWQLKRYGNPPGTSNFFNWLPVGQVSNVRYSPNADCGSGAVLNQNKATAALYYYTPYQPNGAALAAGYASSGDPCSSYGNRNFFGYFSEWFGSPVSAGPGFVDLKYALMGGETGALGAATSGYIDIVDNGGGTGRAFVNGSIYWSPSYGVYAVVGAYREYYFAALGSSGPLGWPSSDRVSISGNGGGDGQSFQFGSVYAKIGGAMHPVFGEIRKRYFSAGGAASPLGWPAGDQMSVTGLAPGLKQLFDHGTIYKQASSDTFVVSGAVETYYTTAGEAGGALGWPTSDLIAIAGNGGGFGQAFAAGSVYSSAVGTFGVVGGLRDYYFALSGAVGSLGWPTADGVCVAGGACSQSFQSGTIYWTPGTGGRVGLPAIETYYEQHSAVLGARTSGLIAIAGNGGGFGQAFAAGSVYSSAVGTFGVVGGLRDYYFALSGAVGSLGWPTADGVCVAGGACSQSFQSGTIYWTPGTGGRVG